MNTGTSLDYLFFTDSIIICGHCLVVTSKDSNTTVAMTRSVYQSCSVGVAMLQLRRTAHNKCRLE